MISAVAGRAVAMAVAVVAGKEAVEEVDEVVLGS